MAGIYWNEEEGIISLSSDGETWLTIADKNLGATTVYNDGDTLSEANAGKYYQWGNNYGFPFSGSVTTSSTQVNAESYGPGNYYSSSTFITTSSSPYDWSSVQNDNLWGGVTGTVEAMQGPCNSGFHIPARDEWSSTRGILTSLGVNKQISAMLKLPLGGGRSTDGSKFSDNMGYYWTTRPENTYGMAYFWSINSSGSSSDGRYRSNGFSIRPFANTPVVPYANEGWTKLYGDELPDRPLPKLKRIVKHNRYYFFGEAPIHASGITLNKSSITLNNAGQTEQLTATVTPEDAINKKIIWTSSDTSVVTVSSTGLVTCVEPGSAIITATCADKPTITATCSVDYIHVTGVTLNNSEIILTAAGQTSQLTATVSPNNAANKNVVWSSSNTSIATVSNTGLVTCVTPGACTITVTTVDGGYTATCSVKKSNPITRAGIYRNATLGLISISSNGVNRITIADKNLGATTARDGGSTLNEANCGKYYQWGNNYGFPFSGSVSTSNYRVNAGDYGPGNYYSSSSFIKGVNDWDNSGNPNLWGGETGTNEAMRGPCASGYHIPSNTEMQTLINTGISLGAWGSTGGGRMITYLKMPLTGNREKSSSTERLQGTYGYYWTSKGDGYTANSYCLYLGTSDISVYAIYRAYGYTIRPFANTPVRPDDGGDWETLY